MSRQQERALEAARDRGSLGIELRGRGRFASDAWYAFDVTTIRALEAQGKIIPGEGAPGVCWVLAPPERTFILTIALGSEGMSDFTDIAQALNHTAALLLQSAKLGIVPAPGLKSGEHIRNAASEQVGKWEVAA